MKAITLIVLLAALFVLAGCASAIAPKIVAPQRGGFQGSLQKSPGGKFVLEDIDAYVAGSRRIAVGPPPAKLAIQVIPPGDYSVMFGNKQRAGCTAMYLSGSAQAQLFEAMNHRWLREHHMSEAEGKRKFAGDAFSFTPAPVPATILRRYRVAVAGLRRAAPPRGTVILLPGYGVGKLSMLPWALLLGRAGYQSILVDLRAQGQSTGNHVTYGVLESRDLVQLISSLRKAGLIRGRLGLLGDSMGAATALLAAPDLPNLAAIVAISPYGRATTVIPRYARLAAWYASLVPSGSWKAAERKAGRIAGVSLAKAAPIDAVPQVRAPVLYLQGGKDRLVKTEEVRQLASRTPHSDLEIYPKLGHLQVSNDYPRLARPIIGWYNRYLAQSPGLPPAPETGNRPQNSLSLSLCVR